MAGTLRSIMHRCQAQAPPPAAASHPRAARPVQAHPLAPGQHQHQLRRQQRRSPRCDAAPTQQAEAQAGSEPGEAERTRMDREAADFAAAEIAATLAAVYEGMDPDDPVQARPLHARLRRTAAPTARTQPTPAAGASTLWIRQVAAALRLPPACAPKCSRSGCMLILVGLSGARFAAPGMVHQHSATASSARAGCRGPAAP